MNLYIDLDLLRVVAMPGYPAAIGTLRLRRNDTVPLVVQFIQSGVVVDPGAAATTLYFAANSTGNYSQNPNMIAIPLTKSGSGSETQYAGDLAVSGAGVNGAFAVGPDIAAIYARGELTWFNAAGTASVTTEAFSIEIANDIYRGNAAGPTQSLSIFLPTVTGLTGGGTANLDGVPTVGVSVPQLYVLSVGLSSQLWQLAAGSDVENAAGGIVRPDDFNALTNAKVFKRIG